MRFIEEINGIRFYAVKPDINGNSRIITHFNNLLTEDDYNSGLKLHYVAVRRAKRIGGQIYRGKDFAGGIVFQGQPKEVERNIREVAFKSWYR